MASMNALRPLLIDELRDLLDAEKQLTRALPKMARAASSTSLKRAFEKHFRETEGHVARLEHARPAPPWPLQFLSPERIATAVTAGELPPG